MVNIMNCGQRRPSIMCRGICIYRAHKWLTAVTQYATICLTVVIRMEVACMDRESVILQQSEWYIMEKLWETSPRTIVQLYHALKEEPGWSKSTVNTLLGRMVDKGIIYFEEGAKARQYYPVVRREDAAMAETEHLLKRVYQGSVSMMMSTLVKKQALSDEEIDELYEILRKAR